LPRTKEEYQELEREEKRGGAETHKDDAICTVLMRELDVLDTADALDDDGDARCTLPDPGDVCEHERSVSRTPREEGQRARTDLPSSGWRRCERL